MLVVQPKMKPRHLNPQCVGALSSASHLEKEEEKDLEIRRRDCHEVDSSVDKPRAVDLKRMDLLRFLYHTEFFEIFFTITLNRV